jgi:molybdopterin biosynthesis enzyme MoaB
VVLPLDVPNTPNLTWTVTKPVAGGTQIDGFTATTRVGTMVQGQYSAQVTRQLPVIQGGTPSVAAKESKQAVISVLPTPSFLAEVK